MNPFHKMRLFDTYELVVPSGLICSAEGSSVLLTDAEKRFVISFAEGMERKDMLPAEQWAQGSVCTFQCCRNGTYIHLRRPSDSKGGTAFFHMELEDEDGRTLYLPGQMTAKEEFCWAEGIEPVLLAIMDGLKLL